MLRLHRPCRKSQLSVLIQAAPSAASAIRNTHYTYLSRAAGTTQRDCISSVRRRSADNIRFGCTAYEMYK
eukprot:3742747-Pleurochrysis_carterae.AAC.1